MKPGKTNSVPEPCGALEVGAANRVWRRPEVAITALLLLIGGGLSWWQPWRLTSDPASVEREYVAPPNTNSIAPPPVANTRQKLDARDQIPEGVKGVRREYRAMVDLVTDNRTSTGGVDVNATVSLHNAAIKGDFKIVHSLLLAGADANARAGAGFYPGGTPLHFAAYAGHTRVAELLLAYGAATNATDEHGNTPLRRTVEQGHLAMAELLINNGADMVTRDTNRKTLLHIVARTRHVAIAEWLIKGGVDINAMDSSSFTALDYAQGGEVRMTEVLQRHGAMCTIC